MKIDAVKCIGCGNCQAYCPAGAISCGLTGALVVSEDTCFECGLCRYAFVCPEGAFIESDGLEDSPRVLRSLFSDPNTTHKSTMVPGRGTEESKTNDVTGLVGLGELGFCVELGRPGVGCSFRDVSLMTEGLQEMGVRFFSGNPLVTLMDNETGRLLEDILGERIISAIIEIGLPEEDLEPVLEQIFRIGKSLNTVFSLSLICRFDEKGSLPILDKLALLGLTPSGSVKVNMGLGFPSTEEM